MLTQAATLHAQALGRRAVLDVMDKDRAAITTYQHLGWIRIGTVAHAHGDGLTEPATAYVSPASDSPT